MDPKHPMGSDHWGHQLVTKQIIQRFSHSKAGLNHTEIPTAVAVGSHNYSCCSYSPVAACKTPTPLVLAHVTEISALWHDKIDKISDFLNYDSLNSLDISEHLLSRFKLMPGLATP